MVAPTVSAAPVSLKIAILGFAKVTVALLYPNPALSGPVDGPWKLVVYCREFLTIG